MNERSNFDEKAQTWDANPMQKARNEAVAAAIRRTIPLSKLMHALDYGAGTGLLSLDLSAELGSILAVDTSKGMLDQLGRKLEAAEVSNISVVSHDLSTAPLEGGPFDLIYTVMTLHHVEDVDTVLDRFASLLKKGGHIAIAELVEEDGSFHGDHTHTHHHGFRPGDLEAELGRRGFSELSSEEVFLIEREGGTFPVFLLTGVKT